MITPKNLNFIVKRSYRFVLASTPPRLPAIAWGAYQGCAFND